jgi:hypothetical protein
MFTDAAYFVFGLIIGAIVAIFQYAVFIAGITRGMSNQGKFGGKFARMNIRCEIEQENLVEFVPTCTTKGCMFRAGHHGGCADENGSDLPALPCCEKFSEDGTHHSPGCHKFQ